MQIKDYFKSISSGFSAFSNMAPETAKGVKTLLIILLLGDMFFVMYYLKAMKIGIVLFLIIVVLLSILMMNERREPERKVEDSLLDKTDSSMDFGLGSIKDSLDDTRKSMAAAVNSLCL